ncbi:MAG: SPFH domain-containing protein [Sulfolobaceae archaeon]
MSKTTNVIEWKNAGPDDIIWVYPDENIRWGSVVVVHEYETAIFMRDGKVYDVLPPGRHVLSTLNLPLLTRAYNLIAGYGETPFKATIVFVSLKQFRGRFGINTRVKLGPRTYYMTELQAYGEFYYRVADPVLFLTQISGAVKTLSSEDFSSFIRSFFAELFIQEISKYSAIEIYSNLEVISSKIKSGNLYEAFKNRGLELLDVKIAGISLPLLEKAEREDPTYTLPLLIAIQKGDEDKVLEITKVVESLRALGQSPGVGILGALFALPQIMGQVTQPVMPQQTQTPPQQQLKSPYERLKELKRMLDDGLITKEEYEEAKKKILKELEGG